MQSKNLEILFEKMFYFDINIGKTFSIETDKDKTLGI